MPQTKIQVYRERNGEVPFFEWLLTLKTTNVRAFAKCSAIIQRLERLGHELRRPESAPLRDDIHELRTRIGTVNYRILYSFNGRNVALLFSGCTKEDRISEAIIDMTVTRRARAIANPKIHIATFP